MKIKLFAFDLDGTLTQHKPLYWLKTAPRLKSLREKTPCILRRG